MGSDFEPNECRDEKSEKEKEKTKNTSGNKLIIGTRVRYFSHAPEGSDAESKSELK